METVNFYYQINATDGKFSDTNREFKEGDLTTTTATTTDPQLVKTQLTNITGSRIYTSLFTSEVITSFLPTFMKYDTSTSSWKQSSGTDMFIKTGTRVDFLTLAMPISLDQKQLYVCTSAEQVAALPSDKDLLKYSTSNIYLSEYDYINNNTGSATFHHWPIIPLFVSSQDGANSVVGMYNLRMQTTGTTNQNLYLEWKTYPSSQTVDITGNSRSIPVQFEIVKQGEQPANLDSRVTRLENEMETVIAQVAQLSKNFGELPALVRALSDEVTRNYISR